MKYTENYQPKALQENAKFLEENVIVKLLKLLTGTAGAAGGGAVLDMARDIGRNIRHNEFVRSGAKAGFGGTGLGTSDLITRAIMPNLQITDIQRALGRGRR